MFWLWLLLYGLLFAVPRALMPAAAPLLTPALLAVYWAALLRGLHTRGRLRSYGLCRGRGLTARDALLSLPVLLFAALNIAFGGARPGIAEAVYLLFAVFGEEVLFRGVLPAVWGEKLGAAGAAAASAALFALLHLGSAVGGSVSAAAVQALCAFGAGLLLTSLAMGLLLTAVRARTGSIALPLLAHALINLTGSGAVSAAPQAAAYLAASALCTLCALRLLRDAA